MPRRATVSRKTRETDITLTLDLDGSGLCRAETGIGFLDHMLDAFARHGRLDLDVRARGDLHVDMHHTIEDVGIVLGQALAEALGDWKGLRRFGHAYCPMDETLTRAAVDLSGRPYLVWKAVMPRAKLGDVDTELFKEWFHAFAMNGRLCLHLENLYGENTHHIVESCFKAAALALRDAVEIDSRLGGAAPSTKGTLTA